MHCAPLSRRPSPTGRTWRCRTAQFQLLTESAERPETALLPFSPCWHGNHPFGLGVWPTPGYIWYVASTTAFNQGCLPLHQETQRRFAHLSTGSRSDVRTKYGTWIITACICLRIFNGLRLYWRRECGRAAAVRLGNEPPNYYISL